MKHTPELEIIKMVAAGLQDLLPHVVFVGGITTCLYLIDKNAPDPTPTDDVDLILELTSALAYENLEKKLSILGFKRNLAEPGPLCRYFYHSIKVDIMPIDPKILGFSNPWYASGLKSAESLEIEGLTIQIFDLPHFLASKISAFLDRGQNLPFWESKDLEDIFMVLDGGADPKPLILKHTAINTFLSKEFQKLLKDEARLLEAIEGVLAPYGKGVREPRAKKVLSNIREISELE